MAKKTVLVVEDDSVTRQFIRVVLQKQVDCNVVEARDGREAIIRAQQVLPDLVLLDYMMPILNGEEVLDRFRSHPQLKDIPVIVLSAVNDKAVIVRLASRHIVDYVVKPLTGESLSDRVLKALLK